MSFESRRAAAAAQMEPQSILILHSGIASHISVDEYYPFEANRNFFYLTGLRRDNMTLVMIKNGDEVTTTLYIEEADPSAERWTGKMVTVSEAQEITGIQDVKFVESIDSNINRLLTRNEINYCYFDCYRHQKNDLPDYNLVKAQEFSAAYPAITLRSIWPILTKLRMQKDADEISKMTTAINITDQALQHVLKTLNPEMKEYQVQANFEYMINYLGAEGTSFPTIAGSGKNGTMLHYGTNRETCADGTLVLLDLGAKYEGYCADITRTYPVNGKFTERQRQVYNVVLKANRVVAETAKPGMSLKELNEVCKKVLAEGCISLGLIKDESELSKYYMHSVSHHLGIDVHDCALDSVKLAPGCVITDEPGLYIDEWEIGIRIEDDLLITEDGCRVLSADVIREADEIEAFMAN